MSESSEEIKVWIKVANASHDHAVSFVLEPWGEVYSMAPGTKFDVVGEGPPGESFYIEWAEDRIVVYGWKGADAIVYENGRALNGDPDPRPPIPSAE